MNLIKGGFNNRIKEFLNILNVLFGYLDFRINLSSDGFGQIPLKGIEVSNGVSFSNSEVYCLGNSLNVEHCRVLEVFVY